MLNVNWALVRLCTNLTFEVICMLRKVKND